MFSELSSDEILYQQIASLLSDYIHIPKTGMDAAHVKKWVMQFGENDRSFILEQTRYLLSIGYQTKEAYKNRIRQIAHNPNNERFHKHSGFLSIQKKGSSQREIIDGLYSEVGTKFKIITRLSAYDEVRAYKSFVYIDDVSFSGEKAVSDLKWLINTYNLRDVNIQVYLFTAHTLSMYYIKNGIENIYRDRNITIVVGTSGVRTVENRKFCSSQSGVFWPREYSVSIPAEFKDCELYKGVFRNGYSPNNSFRDELSRDRFESILTKVGFNILLHRKAPSDVLKPLGFSTFNGLGFGGTTFTYRNCPNNAPLAFWWGDYEPTGTSALDCWYPLMKRIGYNE